MRPENNEALTHYLLFSVEITPLEPHFLERVLGERFGSTAGLWQVHRALGLGENQLELGIRLYRQAYRSVLESDGDARELAYVYLEFKEAQLLSVSQLNFVKTVLGDHWNSCLALHGLTQVGLKALRTSLGLCRLELKLGLRGHDWGREPQIHYVVQTDVQEGFMPEVEAWYDHEHLPGLASVPGCMAAKRLINHDAGPRSFACYDLESERVLSSEPWMAVRATDWSTKARPYFVNPKRLIMQRL
jgi:hypothetical protein